MIKLKFVLAILLSMSLYNCKKSEDTTQAPLPANPTKTDTILGLINNNATTFIVLRHAEKESTGTDPNLSNDGIVRANELKNLLNDIPVEAVYTTPYNRTRQTVLPLANAKAISITEYQITDPYAQLVNDIRTAHHRKVVVIVGHTNTVPEILRELSGNSFIVAIAESQYDKLFIASLPDSSDATITALKYGKTTP